MGGQVGWKTEATFGTEVVPDLFLPVLSAGLNIDEGYMRSAGIRAGRRTRSPGKLGAKVVGASIEMELPNLTLATFLKHVFGAVSTQADTPTVGEHTHTFTPGAHLGKSMTVQVGVEDEAGTVQPFTLTGSKINQATISANVGEIAKLSAELSAQDYTTATALAAASYAAGLDEFTFVQGAISANGSPVASARSVTWRVAKGLKTDRHAIGGRLTREQREQNHFELTTEITADFENLTLFNLIAAGTQVESVFTFDNGTESLVITSHGQIVGDPPSLTNPGIEEQTIRLDHSSATTDADTCTAVLINGEASAA